MKLIKSASGKDKIKMSRKEWTDLGKKAGWHTWISGYIAKSAGINYTILDDHGVEVKPGDHVYNMGLFGWHISGYVRNIKVSKGEDKDKEHMEALAKHEQCDSKNCEIVFLNIFLTNGSQDDGESGLMNSIFTKNPEYKKQYQKRMEERGGEFEDSYIGLYGVLSLADNKVTIKGLTKGDMNQNL